VHNSLLLAGHKTWHEQRQAISPLFTSRAIANSGYDTTMPASMARLVGEIHRGIGQSPRGIDIYQLIADHILHEIVEHSIGIQLSDAAEIQSAIAEAKKSKTYHVPASLPSSTSASNRASAATPSSSSLAPPPSPVPPSSSPTSGGPPTLTRSKSRALPSLPRHPLQNSVHATADFLAPLGTLDRVLKYLPKPFILPLLCLPSVRRSLKRFGDHHKNIEQIMLRVWDERKAGKKPDFSGNHVHMPPFTASHIIRCHGWCLLVNRSIKWCISSTISSCRLCY
jgi:hypothetical protein